MKKQKESHIIWNRHNPNNKIGKGRYKDVIHHKDENRDNNDIDNLQKMTFGEHASLHHKNKIVTEKTKEKLRGNTNGSGNKGRIFSKEHKKKISIGLKGRVLSEEHKNKLRLIQKGRKHLKETKTKISAANKGMKHPMYGKKHSEETKRKMCLAWKIRKKNVNQKKPRKSLQNKQAPQEGKGKDMGGGRMNGFTQEEISLFREWFDCIQDIHPKYLSKKDYVLAKKLYERLNMRIPNSILKEIK